MYLSDWKYKDGLVHSKSVASIKLKYLTLFANDPTFIYIQYQGNSRPHAE